MDTPVVTDPCAYGIYPDLTVIENAGTGQKHKTHNIYITLHETKYWYVVMWNAVSGTQGTGGIKFLDNFI